MPARLGRGCVTTSVRPCISMEFCTVPIPREPEGGPPDDADRRSNRARADRPAKYDRGRLMNAADIKRDMFPKDVSEWWILRNVAPEHRIQLGPRRIYWWEYDILDWLEEHLPNAA